MSSDSSWQKITLKEAGITLIDCDHKTPKAQESGYPYIAIPQLKDGHVKLDGSERRISAEDFQQWTKKLLPQENDVIVVRRCNSGQSAHVPKNVKWAIGQNLVVLRADGEKVYPPFLRWLLRGDEWWEQVRKYINVGAVFDSLKCREIPLFELTIPPMKEQIEFAQILNSIDDRIALLRETNATLEAIAQALFKSWFVDFDPVHANAAFLENGQAPSLPAEIQALFPSRLVESPQGLIPEGWEIFRLSDITARITKGTTPTTLKKAFTDTGINFVKVESLTEHGEFLTDKFSFIDEETHQLLKRSQLKSGDVLVTIAGTIGRVAEVTEDIIPANTNQAVALIRPIQEKLPSGLIRRFLQRNDSKQHMGERVVQAVQANLSLGSLSDMAVVVPPEAVVGKLYALAFEHIDTSKNNNMRQIKTLTNLRDTLLPRLISGQLRLPEAEAILAEV